MKFYISYFNLAKV